MQGQCLHVNPMERGRPADFRNSMTIWVAFGDWINILDVLVVWPITVNFISKFTESSSREDGVSAFYLARSVLTLHVRKAARVKRAMNFLKFVHKMHRFERFLGGYGLVDVVIEFF